MTVGRWRWWMSVLGAGVVMSSTSACGSDAPDGIAPGRTSARDSSTAPPPWPAPVENVADLVQQAGLDLGPMGTAEHYHPTLRILIDGEPVPIPPNIGVDGASGAMSAVHTHEGDGTIHIEADTVGEVFTLGQLFTQWGVALEEDRIGGVTDPDGVSLTSNGQTVSGDPSELRLRPEQELLLEVR